MNLKETGCEDVEDHQLIQDRVQWCVFMHMVMKLRVPENAGNFFTS
jgi:hypothetical protein